MLSNYLTLSEEEKERRGTFYQEGLIQNGTPVTRGLAALAGITPARGLSWEAEKWRRIWTVVFTTVGGVGLCLCLLAVSL